ncbi:MAG: transporter permease, partial [Glaciihabitans sp.]|nr:transporter permease [Glaciihabitans sp.]
MSKTQVAASGSVSDLQPDAFGPPRGIGGSLRAFFSRIRSGDLGSLPVIIGLVIIWTVFQVLSPNFLSANNLVNLALQCAAGGIIAIGVVLVLLLGQIDLSVGSISGLSAAILAIGLTKLGWSLPVAILIALAAGAVVGLFYAFL